jgi:hypothetical protein
LKGALVCCRPDRCCISIIFRIPIYKHNTDTATLSHQLNTSLIAHCTAKMLAVDQFIPAHKKLSVFRRFARKLDSEQVKFNNTDVYNKVVRPSARLHKHTAPISPPTPPLSRVRSKNDSVIDVQRSPSPHLTKDKAYRKGRTAPSTRHNEIPQVVRERLSRESSSSISRARRGQRDTHNAFPIGSTRSYNLGRLSAPNTSARFVSWLPAT